MDALIFCKDGISRQQIEIEQVATTKLNIRRYHRGPVCMLGGNVPRVAAPSHYRDVA
jgi:hypothetical protein